ncbi:MAG: DUF2461 domain-containing protein [Bacteroidota bacterium]
MITEAYCDFFEELEDNNHKAWFHANKGRYENDVKQPFLQIVAKILPTLTTWEPRILDDPKKALFRINRDIRFSKDKSPYHTIMKAGFSPGGKKSELPGFYLGIDAKKVHVGGGLFMLDTTTLQKIRNTIAADPKALESIVESAEFIQNFGLLKGEKSKRMDKTLMLQAQKTPLIFNKQYYAMAEFPLAPFYGSEGLVDEVKSYFETIKPLNQYLNKILAS